MLTMASDMACLQRTSPGEAGLPAVDKGKMDSFSINIRSGIRFIITHISRFHLSFNELVRVVGRSGATAKSRPLMLDHTTGLRVKLKTASHVGLRGDSVDKVPAVPCEDPSSSPAHTWKSQVWWFMSLTPVLGAESEVESRRSLVSQPRQTDPLRAGGKTRDQKPKEN